MKTAEKIEIVKQWEVTHIKLDHALDSVRGVINVSLESPLIEAIWMMQSLALLNTSKLIDDRAGWLDWYACETEFGKKDNMKATVNKRKKVAKDAKGIVKIIEAHSAFMDAT